MGKGRAGLRSALAHLALKDRKANDTHLFIYPVEKERSWHYRPLSKMDPN